LKFKAELSALPLFRQNKQKKSFDLWILSIEYRKILLYNILENESSSLIVEKGK